MSPRKASTSSKSTGYPPVLFPAEPAYLGKYKWSKHWNAFYKRWDLTIRLSDRVAIVDWVNTPDEIQAWLAFQVQAFEMMQQKRERDRIQRAERQRLPAAAAAAAAAAEKKVTPVQPAEPKREPVAPVAPQALDSQPQDEKRPVHLPKQPWRQVRAGLWRAESDEGILFEVEHYQRGERVWFWAFASYAARRYPNWHHSDLVSAQLAAEDAAADIALFDDEEELAEEQGLDYGPPLFCEPEPELPAEASQPGPETVLQERIACQPPLVREICRLDIGGPRIKCWYCDGTIEHPIYDGMRTVCEKSGLHTAWMHHEWMAMGCLFHGAGYSRSPLPEFVEQMRDG